MQVREDIKEEVRWLDLTFLVEPGHVEMRKSAVAGKRKTTWGATWERIVGSEDSSVMLSFKLAEQHKSL